MKIFFFAKRGVGWGCIVSVYFVLFLENYDSFVWRIYENILHRDQLYCYKC